MALTPRTRLGVHQIVAAIGEGGIGGSITHRHKPQPPRAFKVLPDAFARDGERLASFERSQEARGAESSEHRGIYGLERSSGTLALVMELVDGDDLSQRTARGAIPLDEALPIAKQIPRRGVLNARTTSCVVRRRGDLPTITAATDARRNGRGSDDVLGPRSTRPRFLTTVTES